MQTSAPSSLGLQLRGHTSLWRMSRMWQHAIRILLLVGFISFLFENSIDNDFAFDGCPSLPAPLPCVTLIVLLLPFSLPVCPADHLAIVNNADTDPSEPLPRLWGNDIWGKVS